MSHLTDLLKFKGLLQEATPLNAEALWKEQGVRLLQDMVAADGKGQLERVSSLAEDAQQKWHAWEEPVKSVHSSMSAKLSKMKEAVVGSMKAKLQKQILELAPVAGGKGKGLSWREGLPETAAIAEALPLSHVLVKGPVANTLSQCYRSLSKELRGRHLHNMHRRTPLSEEEIQLSFPLSPESFGSPCQV